MRRQSLSEELIDFKETMPGHKGRKALGFMPKRFGLGSFSSNLQLDIKSWSLDASGMEWSFWLEVDF